MLSKLSKNKLSKSKLDQESENNVAIVKGLEAILKRLLIMTQNAQLNPLQCFHSNRYSYAYVMQYSFLNSVDAQVARKRRG